MVSGDFFAVKISRLGKISEWGPAKRYTLPCKVSIGRCDSHYEARDLLDYQFPYWRVLYKQELRVKS
jgi:hypothetical protein